MASIGVRPGGTGVAPSRVETRRSWRRLQEFGLHRGVVGEVREIGGLARVGLEVVETLVGAGERKAGVVAVVPSPTAGARRSACSASERTIASSFSRYSLKTTSRPDAPGSPRRSGTRLRPWRLGRGRRRRAGREGSARGRPARPCSSTCRSVGQMARPAHEQGDAHGRLVEAVLLEPAVLAEHVSVVAEVDDDRIVGLTRVVERVEDAADLVVEERERRVIRRLDALGVAVGQVPEDERAVPEVGVGDGRGIGN